MISTQTVGVILMAVMTISGLAVAKDVAQQRSLQERMMFYQAEELAMDIELMADWGDGSQISKTFRRDYDSLRLAYNTPGSPGKYWLTLERNQISRKAPVQVPSSRVVNIHGGTSIENLTAICMEKMGSSVDIRKGEC